MGEESEEEARERTKSAFNLRTGGVGLENMLFPSFFIFRKLELLNAALFLKIKMSSFLWLGIINV